MNNILNKIGRLGLFKKMLTCGFLSIITALFYVAFVNDQLKNHKLEILFEIKSSSPLSLDLYADFGNGFSEQNKITAILKANDSLVSFLINTKKGVYLKKTRIDFNTVGDTVQLNNINFLLDGKQWFILKGRDIGKKIKFVSEGSRVIQEKDAVKIPILGNDTYISFTDNYNLATSSFLKGFLLLWPWFLFGLLFLYDHRREFRRENIFSILLSFFVLSIFLKESLSTLTVILIGIFAVIQIIKTKKISIRKEQLGMVLFFVMILAFGRIGSYDQINVQLGLFIIPLFLGLSNQSIQKARLYSFYCGVALIFMFILTVSFVISVFINDEVGLLFFVEKKKLIIGNITYWLKYNNPTFLSFFVLIGLCMYQYLFAQKKINLGYYILYIILVFFTLYLLGSRLALVVFLTIIATMPLSIKWRVLSYLFVFLCLFGYIFIHIEEIDSYRFLMWDSVISSYDGGFFGNGLGSTEEFFINHNNEYLKTKINHPHNQFFTYYYELGILGEIMLLCFFLYYGTIYFIGNQAERLSILFLLLILMITESPFESTKPLYVFTFFICLNFAKPKKEY